MKRLTWIAAAVATPLMMIGSARADFTYSTVVTPTAAPFGAASTAQFGGTSSATALNGTQGIALAVVADQTTAPTTSTDTGTVNFSDVVTVVQTAGNGSTGTGSATFTLTGSIAFQRSDVGGQLSTLGTVTATPVSFTIGNTTYTLDTFSYAQPTVNQPLTSTSAGSISGILRVTAVPEPSSVAALCVGGLLVAAPRLRRLARRVGRSA